MAIPEHAFVPTVNVVGSFETLQRFMPNGDYVLGEAEWLGFA